MRSRRLTLMQPRPPLRPPRQSMDSMPARESQLDERQVWIVCFTSLIRLQVPYLKNGDAQQALVDPHGPAKPRQRQRVVRPRRLAPMQQRPPHPHRPPVQVRASRGDARSRF